jgi:ubiquitin C-terminal hydrolase
MQADDYVMCDDCKEKTKDRKALKLHRLPEVLLIMLKRTMYPSTEKDDRHITFPLEASSPSDLQNLTHCKLHPPQYWQNASLQQCAWWQHISASLVSCLTLPQGLFAIALKIACTKTTSTGLST